MRVLRFRVDRRRVTRVVVILVILVWGAIAIAFAALGTQAGAHRSTHRRSHDDDAHAATRGEQGEDCEGYQLAGESHDSQLLRQPAAMRACNSMPR